MPNYAKRIRDDTVGILLMERKIADLAMAAYRKWIPLVADQVLPSLTADGSLDPDGLMPDIDALMLTQEQWDAILDGEFIPGVQELMALQIEERLEEDDVEIPEEIKVPPVAVAPAIPMGKAATRIYAVPALRDLQASYLENVRNRMVRTPDTVFREIAKDINLGMADGEGIKDLRKRVQVFLDGNLDDWKGRAETVARTEATGAYNGASHAASEFRAELHGVELEKVWVATMDSRTRKTHFAADGQRRRMNERFKVGRANLRYPGDPAGPAGEIINCVTGDALVAWPGDHVLNVTRRTQQGTFVQLSTVNGHQLTVTPNHPVLTLGGYVPAGSIKPGQYLVATAVAVTPEVQDGPPRADETFRAARKFGTEQRVVGAAVQFHGDAAEGAEVQVVSTDSELWHKSYPAMKGTFRDSRFYGLSDAESPCFGDSGAKRGSGPVVPGLVDAGTRSGVLAGSVGAGGERSSLVGGQRGHADTIRFRTRTDRQASLFQSAHDQGTRDPETLAHLQDADALGMQLSEVAHVDLFTGRHQVYNLSTGREWYTANGIALHNCRCSMLELEPDDELPGETDRQTERSTTDATVRNRVGGRVGDIKGEVDRRSKEEGITRARDDEDGEGIVASANTEEKHMARPTWTGVLAPLGTPTGDGRIIKEGAAITFRDFPLPLSWQKTSADGHLQSVVIGGIVAARVEGTEITAEGFLLETPEANEAKDLLAEKLIRPSIDPADVVWEMVDEAGNPVDYEQMEAAWMAGEDFVVLDQFAEMKVMGATLVDHPAFAEAQITLDAEPQEEIAPADSEEGDDAIDVAEAEASLVASVAAIAERRITDDFYVEKPDVFEDPGFTEVTRLHMTDDGRVQGHVAAWGTCHVGYTNECKTPPHSMTNYGYFHQSEIGVPGGRLGVGRLTVGGGHADSRLGMQAALSHYDNTGASWAFVRAGEDEHGIWVSGVPHPAATTLQIAEGLSAPLSGDWRRRGGNLEMIAALAVVSGGFPQPRGYRDDAGREGSLVAAGALQPSTKAGKPNGKSIEQIVADAATRAVENYAARQQREARVAAVHLRITERKRAFVAEVATKIAAG